MSLAKLFDAFRYSTWAVFRRGGKPLTPANKLLPAIHKAAPLGEVIFGGVRERDDARDHWSFWSQNSPGCVSARPEAARVDTRLVLYLRNRDLVDATWSPP